MANKYSLIAAVAIVTSSAGAYMAQSYIAGQEGIGPILNADGKISQKLAKAFIDFSLTDPGFKTIAYLDSARIPTICNGTTVYPDGRRVELGDVATRTQCAEYMNYHLEHRSVPALERCLAGHNPDVPSLWTAVAVLDHMYHIGQCEGKGIQQPLQQGDWKRVAAEMRRWVLAGKPPAKQTGLLARAERRAKLLEEKQ
jgi:GH24 family phage-related lysozyme (muramidase)